MNMDGAWTLELSGELDIGSAATLSRQLNQMIACGCTAMIVDVERVTFMDCAGISPLIAAHRQLDGGLRLRGARGMVARLLAIAGLDAVLTETADRPPGLRSALDGHGG